MQWENSRISWLYLCNLRRKNRRCVTAEKLMEQRRHGHQNRLPFPALGLSCQKGKFEQVVMITVSICRKGRSFFGELLGKVNLRFLSFKSPGVRSKLRKLCEQTQTQLVGQLPQRLHGERPIFFATCPIF